MIGPAGPSHAGAPVVVVSPHLDDAVLSAWHVLSSAAATTVVTVFAGIPPPGTSTIVDRLNGAAHSETWMRRRREEDVAALASTGATALHLEFLDAQYRLRVWSPELRAAAEAGRFVALAAREPELHLPPEAIAQALRPALTPGCVLYLPAGIGDHPDHRAVARTGPLLAAQAGELRYYADSPYFVASGVPSWFPGGHEPWTEDRSVRRAFDEIEVDCGDLRLATVELDSAHLEAKVHAIGRYRTEQRHLRRRLSLEKGFGYAAMEAYWTAPASDHSLSAGPQ